MAESSIMPAIPMYEALFKRYFAPHYDDNDRCRKIFPIVRGDLEKKYKPGLTLEQLSTLNPKWRARIRKMIRTMVSAARTDWARYLPVKGKPSLAWIDAFDRHYDRAEIRRVIDRSDPSDFSNDYLVICCEMGALIGDLMTRFSKNLDWVYEYPYWESFLYHRKTGTRVNVFHWAIKKLSDYGVDDGFTEKIRAALHLLESGELDRAKS